MMSSLIWVCIAPLIGPAGATPGDGEPAQASAVAPATEVVLPGGVAGVAPAANPVQSAPTAQDDATKGLSEQLSEMRNRLDRLEATSDAPGTSRFLVTGFGEAGYTNVQGENSSYTTQFNPIFLYDVTDRLFFESELEFELADEGTEIRVEFADVSYLINDYMVASAGKFLTPLSHFARDLHPGWINKLPDSPLYARDDGIVPISSVGAELSGAVPVADCGAKVEYDAWVENGPVLDLTGENASRLEFGSSADNNGNKTLGARVGFDPTESLSVGAAAMFGRVDEAGSGEGTVHSNLESVDATYIQPVDALASVVDIRGEYARSKVGSPNVPYLDENGVALPAFDNLRSAGYLQASIRPSNAADEMIRDLELVSRYEFLNGPNASGAPDIDRVTLGLDWWLSPSSVLKVAYRIEKASDNSDSNALLLQWAMGF